jgi:hypothetical protein
VPGRLRAPILGSTLLAAAITARVLCRLSSGPDSYLRLSFSLLIGAAFFGRLRPREVFPVTVSMISFPQEMLALAHRYAIWRIDKPKNKKQRGNAQFTVIRSENTSAWLWWFCQSLLPSDRLWPATPHEFRRRFGRIMELLGLENLRLKPSSLRPGGATWFYSHGVDPPRLKFWGRWASERSLNHYVQEAVAAQLSAQVPVRQHRLIHKLLKYGDCFLHVPTVPWWALASRPSHAKAVCRAASTGVFGSSVPPLTSVAALYPAPA